MENEQTIYYQYEANEEGVIIVINSSSQPFAQRQIPKEKVKSIRVGKTKVSEI
jgi:hypothetical protein